MATVDIGDVEELARAVQARPSPRVRIRIDALPPDERNRWEARLNYHLHACGCTEGGLFLIVAVSLYAIAAFGRPTWLPSEPLAILGIGLAIALVAAGAGKAVGKVRGRKAAHRDVDRLEALLKHRQGSV